MSLQIVPATPPSHEHRHHGKIAISMDEANRHPHRNQELYVAAEDPEEFKAPEVKIKDTTKLKLKKIEGPHIYAPRLSPAEEKERLSKKKVLLILPVDFKTNTLLPKGLKHHLPPLGMLYIASCIRELGAEVKILDIQVEMEGKIPSEENFRLLLKKEKPDFIGVGATIINWDAALRSISIAKELFPEVKIFAGGPQVTALGTDALEQQPLIDFVINGEGEEVISNLLRESAHETPDYERVRGLIFKTGDFAYTVTGYNMFLRDLNKIPFPAWDLVKLDHYALSPLMQFQPGKSVNMISSRGCVFSCIFCDHGVRGSGWRARSPENVVAEFKYLHSLGVRNVWLVDDLFTVSRPRVHEICDLLVKEKLDMTWSCQARVDCVDEVTLRKMKAAGCRQVSYGIESGSPRILEFIKKKLNMDTARKTLQLTRQIGIESRCFFMIGFPTETKEEMEQTIQFALELNPAFITLSLSTPLPNTEMWDMLKDQLQFDSWNQFNSFGSDKLVFVPNGMTQEELLEIYKKAHRAFLLRPRWWMDRTLDVIKNPYNLMRYYRASSALQLMA